MDKILFNFVLFYLAAHCVICVPQNEKSTTKVGSLTKSLKEYVNANNHLILNPTEVVDISKFCPGLEKKYTETIDELRECLSNVDIGSNTMCATIKSAIKSCSKPIIDLANKCLPSESKGIPSIIEKIVIGLLNQACDSTVEELLEYFNPCQFEENYSDFPGCQKLMEKARQFETKFITKDDLCWMIPQLSKCTKDVRTASCPNPITRNSVAKVYNAIKKETQEVCEERVAV